MSVKIINPNEGSQFFLENSLKIEGTANEGVVLVRVSSPIGNKDFFLGNAVVIDGKWSLSYQFTLGGDRLIVAEGFNQDNEEIAEDKITILLESIENDPTGSVTIISPSNDSDLNLEVPINFKGKLSEDVKKVTLRSPFNSRNFPLGTATITDQNWQFSFKFNTGAQREVIADGFSESDQILGSAKVIFNLTSSLSDSDFKVIGVQNTTKAFREKVAEVAQRINVNPLFLMAVMSFETGGSFSPSKRNPVSGATGLIQFLSSTARGLGTTIAQLANMTAIEQLDFVEKYFKQFNKPLNSLEDTYMAVLFPKAIGKGRDFVLFSKPSREYDQNKGLDSNGNGKITVAEASQKVRDRIV